MGGALRERPGLLGDERAPKRPEHARLRTGLNIELNHPPNLERLVIDVIEANLCNQILILLHFSRSTRLAFLCTFGIVVWEKHGKTHSRSPKRKRTKREAAARKSENRKPNQHAPDLMSKDEGALRSTNVLQKLKSTTRLRCLESKTKGETALRKTRTMPALRNTTKRNAKSANAPRTPLQSRKFSQKSSPILRN